MDIESFNDMSIEEFVNSYFNGSNKEELIKQLVSVGIDHVENLDDVEYTGSDLYSDGEDKNGNKIKVTLDSGIINNLKDLVVSKRSELGREREIQAREAVAREAAEYRLQDFRSYDVLSGEHPLLDYLAKNKKGSGKRKKYSKKKKKSKSKRRIKSKRKRSRRR
jgi:hypothetical protein